MVTPRPSHVRVVALEVDRAGLAGRHVGVVGRGARAGRGDGSRVGGHGGLRSADGSGSGIDSLRSTAMTRIRPAIFWTAPVGTVART